MNIHTHFIPLLSVISMILPHLPFSSAITSYLPFDVPVLFPSGATSEVDALPRYLFFCAAAACLACSTIWHTSCGSADTWVLMTGARTDYVGIGWLISCSAAACFYYGFSCHPTWLAFYIGLTVASGIAGSIAPFQAWFDERRNKMKRVAFFVALSCMNIIPLLHMTHLKGGLATWDFFRPVMPSILSYTVGLIFYATHFPECVLPGKFDYFNSHTIWHVFIIIAIRAHWRAVETLHARSLVNVCLA